MFHSEKRGSVCSVSSSSQDLSLCVLNISGCSLFVLLFLPGFCSSAKRGLSSRMGFLRSLKHSSVLLS